MKAADNKRTTQMCKFLVDCGIPTQSEPNTFEDVALKWIDEMKSNRNHLHESDIDIIRKSGLSNHIFGIEQNVITALQQQLAELTQKLAQLTAPLPQVQLPQVQLPQVQLPQVQLPQNEIPDIEFAPGTNVRVIQQWSRYKRAPEKYEDKVILCLRNNPQGASRKQLHKSVGGFFNGPMLDSLINRLESKNLIQQRLILLYGKYHAKYFSTDKTLSMPLSIENEFGFFDPINQKWEIASQNISTQITIKQLGDHFGQDIPNSAKASFPFWKRYLRIIQKHVGKGQTQKRKRKWTPPKPNPDITWAKPFCRPGTEGYQISMTDNELIGFAELVSKGKVYRIGIENYGIYPSGSIKLILRKRNIDGSYKWLFYRWSNSKDLQNIIFKPEFDIFNSPNRS